MVNGSAVVTKNIKRLENSISNDGKYGCVIS